MARKRRVIHPGFCYHVMLRGVGGRIIFNDDHDRSRFCLLLQYASEVCEFKVHGFCLMSNHVHLILQPLTSDLSTGMHRLAFRYAQYFNAKMKRQGYLFQSRFKAVIVQHGAYLSRLIRYVHRNPVRANMVSQVSSYTWSSHLAYLEKTAFTWLKTDLILELFNSYPGNSHDSFEKYIYANDNEVEMELEDIRRSMAVGAYGSESFVGQFQEEIKEKSLTSLKFHYKHAHQSKLVNNHSEVTIETILEFYLMKMPYTLEQLQSSSRKALLVEARAKLAWLISNLRAGSRQEVAALLQRDPSLVGRLEEKVTRQAKLRELAEELKKELLLMDNHPRPDPKIGLAKAI